MAKPKIIMHNSICPDGSFRDIDVDMHIHYGAAARFREDIHMVGADNAKTGIAMFGGLPSKCEVLEKEHVWLVYRVKRTNYN
ncbi:MAG: hypothetical protein ACQESU_01890 [Halobacteriota archaeon]